MKVLTFKLSPYVRPRSINKLIHGFEIELSVGLRNYTFHSNLSSSLKYKFISRPNSALLYKKVFSSFFFEDKLNFSKLGLIGLHYNERKYYTSRPNSKYQSEANEDGETSETTHFGNETVTKEEKAKKVHNVFENVASKYDLMNDVMSGGIHRIWKDRFVASLNPTAGIKLLDVAGGTGDITFRVLQRIYNEQKHRKDDSEGIEASSRLADFEEDIYPPQEPHHKTQTKEECKITVCDISEEMLRVGEERALSRGYSNIDWVCGDAQNLPFPDKSFDAYTIAYGMRNVVDVEKALNEAYRVLKPGGRFLCLEFSQVRNSLIRSVYDLYSFQVIPVMGQVIAADWDSYQYLVESIRKFPDQKTYRKMIEDAGFRRVRFQNLTFGVTAIHSGFKI